MDSTLLATTAPPRSLAFFIILPLVSLTFIALYSTILIATRPDDQESTLLMSIYHWLWNSGRFVIRRIPLIVAPYLALWMLYSIPREIIGSETISGIFILQYALIMIACASYSGGYFTRHTIGLPKVTTEIGPVFLLSAIAVITSVTLGLAHLHSGATIGEVPIYLVLVSTLVSSYLALAGDKKRSASLSRGKTFSLSLEERQSLIIRRAGLKVESALNKMRLPDTFKQRIMRHPLRAYYAIESVRVTAIMTTLFTCFGLAFNRLDPDVSSSLAPLMLIAIGGAYSYLSIRRHINIEFSTIQTLSASYFDSIKSQRRLAIMAITSSLVIIAVATLAFNISADYRYAVYSGKSAVLAGSLSGFILTLTTARFLALAGLQTAFWKGWPIAVTIVSAISTSLSIIGGLSASVVLVSIGALISCLAWVAAYYLLGVLAQISTRTSAKLPSNRTSLRKLAELLLGETHIIERRRLHPGVVHALLEAGYVTTDRSSPGVLVVTEQGVSAADRARHSHL